MSKRLIILTSRKNFIWVSMEEIITWIETSWETWSKERGLSCKIINVDDFGLKPFIKEALISDFIIVTCFNVSIASYLFPLRTLSIQTPWIFYLHGLASFGSWPLFHWKIGQQLTTKDVFIASCNRDKEQFRLIFKNIHCEVIPFGMMEENILPYKKNSLISKLAFIGRISSQKNLHTLLLALHLLKDSNWEMHFFGKEDNYGSPLMGRRENNYQDFLKNLCDLLKINHKVFFHGFVKRDKIDEIMNNESWTFISPSIHSDENFGMAAFRCLLKGHKAILSNWGGHYDFQNEFADSLSLVSVYKSEIGPFIDVIELADAIEKMRIKVLQDSNVRTFPKQYSTHEKFKKFESIFNYILGTESKGVIVNPLLNEIISQRDLFLKENDQKDGSQIFKDYKDPMSKIFFDRYGQIEYKKADFAESIVVYPWVQEECDHYEVNDPHRGYFQLYKKDYPKQTLLKLGLAYLKSE